MNQKNRKKMKKKTLQQISHVICKGKHLLPREREGTGPDQTTQVGRVRADRGVSSLMVSRWWQWWCRGLALIALGEEPKGVYLLDEVAHAGPSAEPEPHD